MTRTISPDPFEWKEEYRVGVQAIDEHREKFFGIINNLKQVVTRKECESNVAGIFFSLVHYTEHYLINEEIYFKELGYSGFSRHQEIHNNFIVRIIQFKEEYRKGRKDVCEKMYFFLEDWLTDHILNYDNEAVAWLKEKGLR